MNEVRLYKVLVGPHTTEKSVTAAEKFRQISFKVAVDATKTEVKQAVEKLFNVVVEAVRITNVKGKHKRFKQMSGKRSDWKKASISLKKGQDINLAEFE
jgi:large subunit ribosomal protein L23